MMSKTKIITAFILVSAFLAPAAKAGAVTISELNVELNADPGETIERVIELYDDSRQGVTVYPAVYNFEEDPALPGSATVLTNPADLKPDREWVKYDVEKIDLPADASRVQFSYRIVLPNDAEPGTHLISLVFRTLPPEANPNSTSVAIGTNVAANLFVKVTGATVDAIDATLQVGSYSTYDPKLPQAEQEKKFVPKTFFFKPPVDFLVTVSNSGNTHQKPDGNVKIYNDFFGSTADQFVVNRENRIVLPGSTRTFLTERFGKGLMIGKYRAKLSMIYGDPLRDATDEVEFWIIPVVELLIALGILLVLCTAIILWRKIAKKRKQKREKEKEEAMRKALREEIEKSVKKRAPSKKKRARKKKKPDGALPEPVTPIPPQPKKPPTVRKKPAQKKRAATLKPPEPRATAIAPPQEAPTARKKPLRKKKPTSAPPPSQTPAT
jgi:hypothetical protein